MKIATFVFFILTSPLFARSPAVEPVQGISIEEYREVDSTQAKGYDFAKYEAHQTRPNSELSFTTGFFLLVVSALPFVVWFGVMRALPDATPKAPEQGTQKPNLSIINGEGRKDDDDDHHDLPKAS